jgi:cell wall-associated NlpC family hydrolase
MSGRYREMTTAHPASFLCGIGYITLVTVAITTVFSGCVPAVRYTRQPTVTADKYLVPRNWDYRAGYQVPPARLNAVIASYIGTRYRIGGMSRKGVDCSGFVCLVFREVNHTKLGRSTAKLHRYGYSVSRERARVGDLVFFRGGIWNTVNHVGIYLGKGKFAHASSSRGVMYSSLDEKYFRDHFVDIRRIF